MRQIRALVELQRTLAVARLIMPELNIQSPPNLVCDDFPELLAAGINDWGGISPVTQDFINPEAAWPQIRVLENAPAAMVSRCARGWRSIPNLPGDPSLWILLWQPGCSSISEMTSTHGRTEHDQGTEFFMAGVDFESALRRARPATAAILEKSLRGDEIDFSEAGSLARSTGDDLLALVKTADEIRRRTIGDVLTYVVNRNLNFTNICIVGCSFCGFSRGPRAKDAYFHSTENLLAKTREAVDAGATELCIQGGLPRDLNGGYYSGLLRDIRANFRNSISTPIRRWRFPMASRKLDCH